MQSISSFPTGKKKKLTFIEVNNDINCMIDIAKVADIVLILIDATFGIEMEVFEFLEICRAHGSPRIMGVNMLFRLSGDFLNTITFFYNSYIIIRASDFTVVNFITVIIAFSFYSSAVLICYIDMFRAIVKFLKNLFQLL